MADVPDNITLKQLCVKAAEALVRSGLDRRIDIYREVEVDDPAIRLMLGRPHRLRVRVKITATSLLFESGGDEPVTEQGVPGDGLGQDGGVNSVTPRE